ncbi:hypothetical protein C8A00DRAFT_19429 [Chaetomidium leptoderma]|uniref:Uncharacterized protein n=1 Tax=Chaetomidium leptoderma TaxID=669021 RepID=A0AAN6VE24_9PEZI|nr:hypothetical protein C8A00DRAFT_19429 [Chaetomidium leptoderma]
MTKVKGLDSGGKQGADATDNLQAIMAKMDPNTEILHISGDVPTNNQWEALGQYFTKIRFLKVATGWEEDWRDEKFPLHWPVELLVIADAVGERITTPAIMEGRVKHLVLFFTAGLRFEGPRTKELMKDAEMLDFIPHKKKQPQAEQPEGATTQAEGGPPDGTSPPTKETPPKPKPDGVKVFSVPHEWHKWVYDKYADKDITFPPSPDGAPPSTHSEMKHLQILGNDALQMLSYLALAKFHLLSSLSTLTIHSQGASDLLHVPPNIPLMLLPSLANLKTFKLTLGSAMYAKLLAVTNDNNEPFLHVFFPPNIETLHFRGPVSMAAHLDAFADAFGYHDEFLPGLKRMSLVLDLPDKSSAFPREPSLAQLREANGACRRVLDAAAARGVVVEEGFEEPWVEEHAGLFDGVDNRWAVLGSGLGS